MQQPSNPNFSQPNQNIKNQQSIENQNFQMQHSNSNFQQQFPNQNMQQQQFINSNMTSNSSMQQQFYNQNMPQQYTNQNMQQQQQLNNSNMPSNSSMQQFSNQNIQQMPSNSSMQQQFSNQNIPQRPPLVSQSSTFSHMQTNTERPIQGFQVIYDNFNFVVDPTALSNASQKFKELIDPYINNYMQMKELHLSVFGNQFSKRNMRNFLRICQNLPTDVQNSEMKEICEIAKMFKAEEIYNKGLKFIQANQDPNFNVPDNKYDGSDGITYLTIEGEVNLIHHDADIEDAYFEDVNNSAYQGNYYKINTNNEYQNDEQQQQQQSQGEPNLNNHSMLHEPESNLNQVLGSTNNLNNENENKNQNTADDEQQNKNDDDDDKENKQKNVDHSAVYQVRFENHTFKCPVFKFVHDNRIVYSAKQKYNEIFIAEGADIHIRDRKSHVCYMLQNETTKGNKVRIGDTTYEIRYVGSGNVNHYAIEVTFPLNGKTYSWIPKPPRYDPKTDKYYLNFHGEYHHSPILSSKNMVLQNKEHKTTFIVRKMDQSVYEIECSPKLDPLIAFTIGLSDIVGPYLDPWANDGADLL